MSSAELFDMVSDWADEARRLRRERDAAIQRAEAAEARVRELEALCKRAGLLRDPIHAWAVYLRGHNWPYYWTRCQGCTREVLRAWSAKRCTECRGRLERIAPPDQQPAPAQEG